MIQKILFVELLGGIGDGLIALPAIKALALSHPQAHLTVLTFSGVAELLQNYSLINRVIVAPRKKARQAVEELVQHSFDLIVSDTNYEGIADIIKGAAKQTVTNLWRNPPANQRVGDRFLHILFEEGLIAAQIQDQNPLIELTRAERAQAEKILGATYRPLMFLIPDAGMRIKRWSPAHFIALGKALRQKGGTIMVVEGEDEQAAVIAEAIAGNTRVWQRGTLRELAAVMAKADLAIGADTGPLRIAAALNVATITLFGPSWHERYGQPPAHINLQGYPQCPERNISNFTQQSCWYSGSCPFDWETCTEEISPQAVAAAADKLLAAGKRDSEDGYKEALISQPLLPEWSQVRNMLVMRLDNVGDVIMTSPTLRALKENLPQAKLTLMASPGGALTAPLLPWVDEVLPWRVLWQDLGRLDFDPSREWRLIETLAARQFDAAVIFTSFSQSPHPPALSCFLAGIPLRLGESKEQGLGILTHEVPSAPDRIHQAERNLGLIESVGFKVSDRHLSLQIPAAPLLPSNPYILLNPWTSCQSRNYDGMRFAIAAGKLSQIKGWQVVVTGVEKDHDRSRPLLEYLGDRAIDLIGRTTLSELTALIANAQLVLTNNTSTMHIADATRTPAVILFAGTELECQWQPRAADVKLLRRPTICSPCYAFTCPYSLECLEIPPESVVAAGLELLQKRVEK